MSLQSRMNAMERWRCGSDQPDFAALSNSDIGLLVRVYEGQSVTTSEREEARRLHGLTCNRDARPYRHLSDATLAERIAEYA